MLRKQDFVRNKQRLLPNKREDKENKQKLPQQQLLPPTRKGFAKNWQKKL